MANTLAKTIEILQNKLYNNSIYSYWVRFKAGNLEIDTSNKDNNIFVSFENVKSGVKKANCFTLSIAYLPSVTSSDDKFGDINYIDKCIASDKNLACELQYGYGYDPDNLVTGKYYGMITNYTKDIEGGMLKYTIKGYSNLVQLIEDRVTINTPKNNVRATDFAAKVLEDIFKEKGIEYSVIIDPSAKGKDEEKRIEGSADVLLFQYIDTLLKSAVDIDTKGKSESEMAYYSYIVDDAKKEVRIIRIDSNTYDESTKIAFDWIDNKNSIVINFKPDYNGIVLATLYQKEYNNSIIGKLTNTVYSIFEKISSVVGTDGKLEKVASIKEDPNVAQVSNEDYQIEKSIWTEAIKELPYTATITLVGIPYDIPILSLLDITPIINTQKDLSAGLYMVTGSVDNIDSGGFTTTINLMKVIKSDESKG